jgi:hypothetical protein
MTLRTILAISTAACLSAGAARAQFPYGLFDAPHVPASYYSRLQDVLDYDGDGKPDLLSAYGLRSLGGTPMADGVLWSVLPNGDTSGSPYRFGGNTQYAYASTMADVSTATGRAIDLDGDQFGDFVIFSSVHAYLYEDGVGPTPVTPVGSFFFGSATNVTSSLLRDAVVADADGDGDDDICTLMSDGLKLFLRGPGYTFAPAGHVAFVADIRGALTAIDPDGDGSSDFLLLRKDGPNLATLLTYRLVGGVLIFAGADAVPGIEPQLLAVGDPDADGDDDVYVCGAAPGVVGPAYVVLRRTGPATLALEPAPINGGPFERFADVDQDGDLDGVACVQTEVPPPSGLSTPLNIHRSEFLVSTQSNGAFAPAFSIPSLGAVRLAAATDLDGDGDVDLVGGRCIHFANGPLVGNPVPPGRSAAFGADPFAFGFADLDGDGDPDVDVGYSAGAAVYRNDGAGTIAAWQPDFPAPPANATYSSPGLAGDWDGDGDVDLVVEQRNGGSYFATRLLRNHGGGAFASAVAAIPGGQRMYVPPAVGSDVGIPGEAALAADFDGDGDLDLAMRWKDAGIATRIWTNDGTGFFTGGPTAFDVYAIAAGDLNGDGAADLVELHGPTVAAQVAYVRYAASGGGFAAPIALPVGTAASAGALAGLGDFDGDGDLDVALGEGAQIQPYRNDGYGTFFVVYPPLPLLGASSTPYAPIVAADFDGDGQTDLMATPPGGVPGGRAFYRRTGPFQFARTTQLIDADAFRDIDGDGDLDAVGAVIARNRLYEGPAAGLRRQFGTGFAGTGGLIPTLGAVGPFRVGSTATVRMRGGRGGATSLLLIGVAPLDLATPFGVTQYASADVVVPFLLGGTAGAAGRGGFDASFTLPPGLEGAAFYSQVAVIDPGAASGFAATAGLQLVIGV